MLIQRLSLLGISSLGGVGGGGGGYIFIVNLCAPKSEFNNCLQLSRGYSSYLVLSRSIIKWVNEGWSCADLGSSLGTTMVARLV